MLRVMQYVNAPLLDCVVNNQCYVALCITNFKTVDEEEKETACS